MQLQKDFSYLLRRSICPCVCSLWGQICKAVGRGVEPAHQSMGSSMPGLWQGNDSWRGGSFQIQGPLESWKRLHGSGKSKVSTENPIAGGLVAEFSSKWPYVGFRNYDMMSCRDWWMLMMVGSYVMSFCCLSSGAQPHLVAFASCWNIPWPMETCHAYASPSEFFHAGSGLRTLLWKMTKGRAPADAAQMGPQVPWVQSWQVPGGCVMFNHLTAAVMLELGALAKKGGVEKSWNRGALGEPLYFLWFCSLKRPGIPWKKLTACNGVSGPQDAFSMLPCVCNISWLQ